MIMYRCEDCGHLFEEGEQKIIVEKHGFEYGDGEVFSYCPKCGGYYEEVEPCKICGSYEDVEDDYCDNCRIQVQKTFSQLLNENFSEEKRKLLNIIYDGEELK